MTPLRRLWLIRHARVLGHEGVIHGSDAPADLNERSAIRARARNLPPEAAAWCSPARRTVETARALGLAVQTLDDLREQDFGAWTGCRHADLARASEPGYEAFWEAPDRSRPPGGESFCDQVSRVETALQRLPAGDHVLVVHSGTVRSVLALALERRTRLALQFVVDPLGLTRIDTLDGAWRIVSVNVPPNYGMLDR